MTNTDKQLLSGFLAGAACLAGALAARAQQATISPARQTVLEAHMANWSTVKTRSQQLSENILQEVAVNPQLSYSYCKEQSQSGWTLAQGLEKKAYLWQSQALATLATDASARKITAQQQAVCTAAVTKTFQLRMLYVYGTLYPQLLNDSVRQNGESVGGKMAGKQWQSEAAPQEKQALAQIYSAQCPAEPSLFVEN